MKSSAAPRKNRIDNYVNRTVPIEVTCIVIKRFGTDKFCAVNNFSYLCGAKITIITLKVVQAQVHVRLWFGAVEKKL